MGCSKTGRIESPITRKKTENSPQCAQTTLPNCSPREHLFYPFLEKQNVLSCGLTFGHARWKPFPSHTRTCCQLVLRSFGAIELSLYSPHLAVKTRHCLVECANLLGHGLQPSPSFVYHHPRKQQITCLRQIVFLAQNVSRLRPVFDQSGNRGYTEVCPPSHPPATMFVVFFVGVFGFCL